VRYVLAAGLVPLIGFIGIVVWYSGIATQSMPEFLKPRPEVMRQTSLRVDAGLFHLLFTGGFQELVLFVLAFAAGAGRIANDIRTNAFVIYLSRPVGKLDYVAGKFAGVAGVLGILTVAAPLLLYAVARLLRPDPEAPIPGAMPEAFMLDWKLPWLVLGFGLLASLYTASAVLLVSAFSESGRGAALRFAALVVLSQVISGIAGAYFRTERTLLLGFFGNFEVVAAWLFGQPPESDLPPATSLAVMLGLVAAGIWVLRARLKAVEVIE
jgi:hypothetical protein